MSFSVAAAPTKSARSYQGANGDLQAPSVFLRRNHLICFLRASKVRFSPVTRTLAVGAVCLLLAGCADRAHRIVVSVPEQRMVLLEDGVPLAYYPVSTSKFGLGDAPGSRVTPLGHLEIARKFGGGAPLGMKFKNREATGEVVAVDAPGRDPVVTRILWLRGLEPANSNAYDRYIYIHGTPEEHRIGTPASYGCVRMRSRDVIRLYDEVGTGARVFIRNQPLAIAAAPYLVPNASVLAPAGLSAEARAVYSTRTLNE